MAVKIEIGWSHRQGTQCKAGVYHEGRPRPARLVHRSRLPRIRRPVIVPPVPWESADSVCRRRRNFTRKRSGKRTVEPKHGLPCF